MASITTSTAGGREHSLDPIDPHVPLADRKEAARSAACAKCKEQGRHQLATGGPGVCSWHAKGELHPEEKKLMSAEGKRYCKECVSLGHNSCLAAEGSNLCVYCRDGERVR
jgi:hypothetical protein